MRTLTVLIMVAIFSIVPHPVHADEIDAVAASVNGQAIACSQVAGDTDGLIQSLKQLGATSLPPRSELEKRALDAKVVELLQEQAAKRLHITVSDDDVAQAMANVETRNHIPAGQLPDVLKAQGIDVADYKNKLKARLLSSKLINAAVRDKIKISEESMREYYRKHLEHPQPIRELHLSQILIALPQEPTPQQVAKAKAKTEAIRRKWAAGQKFDQLARLYSDSPDAKQGGDLGWHATGTLNSRFDSIYALQKGQVSEPIRSPAGFHLIQVTDVQMRAPKLGQAYDEVHARHILIKIPDDADTATRAKIMLRAKTIARDLQGSSDAQFASRAKEVSQGPSADQGGDLGWFRRGTMLKAIEDTAFSLKPGETSGVVETPYGLDIVHLIAKRHIDPNSFEAHRDEIEQELTNARVQEELPRWIASLKAEAQISYFPCPPGSGVTLNPTKP
jgi:peptidyl-prolyl cis-trans isomerase SurA